MTASSRIHTDLCYFTNILTAKLESLTMKCHTILPAALGPEIYSACNRNEYQKQKITFLGSRVWQGNKADNLTTIYEPTV
jgi:hypothetical protein